MNLPTHKPPVKRALGQDCVMRRAPAFESALAARCVTIALPISSGILFQAPSLGLTSSSASIAPSPTAGNIFGGPVWNNKGSLRGRGTS